MDASNMRSSNHQFPGGLEDLARTEFLPELDVEAAVWCLSFHQSRHYDTVTHTLPICIVID
jgi:hypothetical protein